jgi:hypothetical protein
MVFQLDELEVSVEVQMLAVLLQHTHPLGYLAHRVSEVSWLPASAYVMPCVDILHGCICHIIQLVGSSSSSLVSSCTAIRAACSSPTPIMLPASVWCFCCNKTCIPPPLVNTHPTYPAAGTQASALHLVHQLMASHHSKLPESRKAEVLDGILGVLESVQWGRIHTSAATRLLEFCKEAASEAHLSKSCFTARDIFQSIALPVLEACGALGTCCSSGAAVTFSDPAGQAAFPRS